MRNVGPRLRVLPLTSQECISLTGSRPGFSSPLLLVGNFWPFSYNRPPVSPPHRAFSLHRRFPAACGEIGPHPLQPDGRTFTVAFPDLLGHRIRWRDRTTRPHPRDSASRFCGTVCTPSSASLLACAVTSQPPVTAAGAAGEICLQSPTTRATPAGTRVLYAVLPRSQTHPLSPTIPQLPGRILRSSYLSRLPVHITVARSPRRGHGRRWRTRRS